MPLVSIVLPTYNGSGFISEAIESIISQTFLDWELIIVNDCSTDETPCIINQYATIDNRIRVINNPINQKLPQSLNIGFSYATGRYFTWTSDDNKYHYDAIEKMVEYLEEHDKEMMVCARMNCISETGEFQYVSEIYDNHKMAKNNCVGACFLYRANVFTDIGGYDTDFFLVEDYEYWLRTLVTYGNISYINKILYEYRNQSKSLSATRMSEIKYNKAKLQIKYIDMIIQAMVNDKEGLCSIYLEIRAAHLLTQDLREKFQSVSEVFSMIDDGEYPAKVIVYGAGKMGETFWKKYGERIVFFGDRNESKIGQTIGTKKIFPLQQMAVCSNKYAIVVAAGKDKVYDFLITLKEFGISKCYIYSD